jgi:hypothetical protein
MAQPRGWYYFLLAFLIYSLPMSVSVGGRRKAYGWGAPCLLGTIVSWPKAFTTACCLGTLLDRGGNIADRFIPVWVTSLRSEMLSRASVWTKVEMGMRIIAGSRKKGTEDRKVRLAWICVSLPIDRLIVYANRDGRLALRAHAGRSD